MISRLISAIVGMVVIVELVPEREGGLEVGVDERDGDLDIFIIVGVDGHACCSCGFMSANSPLLPLQ